MNLQNGYKVIYEEAEGGKRTFYTSKSTAYPNEDDVVIASFNDEDYRSKVIYEHKGKFYVSTGAVPAYGENGEPADTAIEDFDKVFIHTDVNKPTDVQRPIYAEAISANGDSYCKPTVEGNVITFKITDEIKWLPATGSEIYHNYAGFKITAPAELDPAKIKILRPDGKERYLENIKDGDHFTNLYWKMEVDPIATYKIDWTDDGEYDLTVIIDATEATFEVAKEESKVTE